MMVWEDFYDYVLPYIPAYDPPFVDLMLRNAAIEFCDYTGAHTELITPVNVVAGTAVYTLPSPVVETDVSRVQYVWVDGVRVDPVTEEELARESNAWFNTTGRRPRGYLCPSPDVVQLYPKPDEAIAAGLVANVVLRPALSANGVADRIGASYVFEIAEGCKAMLMEMPGKPWTAPDYAKGFRARFEASKNATRTAVSRSQTRAQQRVRMSRMW